MVSTAHAKALGWEESRLADGTQRKPEWLELWGAKVRGRLEAPEGSKDGPSPWGCGVEPEQIVSFYAAHPGHGRESVLMGGPGRTGPLGRHSLVGCQQAEKNTCNTSPRLERRPNSAPLPHTRVPGRGRSPNTKTAIIAMAGSHLGAPGGWLGLSAGSWRRPEAAATG